MTEGQGRRDELLKIISQSDKPVTGAELSVRFSVSRQVVVQDVAILRARGNPIIATPRGYMIIKNKRPSIAHVFCCTHDQSELERELLLIVNNGGRVVDVIVEHPVYGEFQAELMLDDAYQVGAFVARLSDSAAAPLSALTGGAHFHTVEAENENVLSEIEAALRNAGFLM